MEWTSIAAGAMETAFVGCAEDSLFYVPRAPTQSSSVASPFDPAPVASVRGERPIERTVRPICLQRIVETRQDRRVLPAAVLETRGVVRDRAVRHPRGRRPRRSRGGNAGAIARDCRVLNDDVCDKSGHLRNHNETSAVVREDGVGNGRLSGLVNGNGDVAVVIDVAVCDRGRDRGIAHSTISDLNPSVRIYDARVGNG